MVIERTKGEMKMRNQIKKGPMQLRAEERAKARMPMVQSLKKNGEWGKAKATQRFGTETDEQVIERLHRLNPSMKFRIAE